MTALQNRIVTCADLANVGEAKRRHILQSLNEPEYRDVIFVLQSMPKLTIETRFEGQLLSADSRECPSVPLLRFSRFHER
uniref:Uncharacterized protein n=1 Tax=Parascaris equorum TaxID=6256 RepID=A0A914RWF5_PAREQ